MTDKLYRFLFEERDIRGEIVTLQESYQTILSSSVYPEIVQTLIGELMVAASLLTATLKFEGEIALQIQSEGAISYIIINGTHDQKLRGIAKWDENLEVMPTTFAKCFENGILAITISPKDGQRYQGMVALDKPTLSACIEDYFLQSEQLLTKVFLTTDTKDEQKKAAGLLIQIVPTSSESQNVDTNADFEHIAHLASTITSEEILQLSHIEMIHRLYHEENIRLFDPQQVMFYCDCSKERSKAALKSVAKEELLHIVEQDGYVKMDCQFCHAEYRFDKIDIENIHAQNLDSGNA